jgi:hypothetical protein
MWYLVWIITAFAAVGLGCYLASLIDRKEK